MLKHIIRPALALVLTMALAVPAMAQGFVSDLQKQTLTQLITVMNNAVARRDAASIANNMPERIYHSMAAQMRTTEPALRSNMQKSVAAQLASLAPGAYKLESDNIDYKQGKNGALYALVPTRIDMGKQVMQFATLAVFDNSWHIIYGGQKAAQNPIFAEIYPDLAEISVPPAKITAK